jgi:hypothetical protein
MPTHCMRQGIAASRNVPDAIERVRVICTYRHTCVHTINTHGTRLRVMFAVAQRNTLAHSHTCGLYTYMCACIFSHTVTRVTHLHAYMHVTFAATQRIKLSSSHGCCMYCHSLPGLSAHLFLSSCKRTYARVEQVTDSYMHTCALFGTYSREHTQGMRVTYATCIALQKRALALSNYCNHKNAAAKVSQA